MILSQSYDGGSPLRFDMDSRQLTAPLAIVAVAAPRDREPHQWVSVILLLPVHLDQLGSIGCRLVDSLRGEPTVEVDEAVPVGVWSRDRDVALWIHVPASMLFDHDCRR